jgi:hypothetical protein
MCPVEDTGKNSVIPSIIASIMACNTFIEDYAFLKIPTIMATKPAKIIIGAIVIRMGL